MAALARWRLRGLHGVAGAPERGAPRARRLGEAGERARGRRGRRAHGGGRQRAGPGVAAGGRARARARGLAGARSARRRTRGPGRWQVRFVMGTSTGGTQGRRGVPFTGRLLFGAIILTLGLLWTAENLGLVEAEA